MHTRKHTGGPRRRSRKAILVLALILLLGLAVGGTAAYLSNSTDDVENNFSPATVVGTIQETVKNNVKTSITVRNDGNVACYIRVALVINWVNEDDDICTRHTIPTITPGTGWTLGEDGYYYHTDPVNPTESTANLLSAPLAMTQDEDLCEMQVEIVSSAIQAAGGAKADAW